MNGPAIPVLRMPQSLQLVKLAAPRVPLFPAKVDPTAPADPPRLQCIPMLGPDDAPAAEHRLLVRAWQALARAHIHPKTLGALLTVLRGSYGTPALAGSSAPNLNKVCDIRPWLNDPEAVRSLLLQLVPCWSSCPEASTLPAPEAALVAAPFAHHRYGIIEDVLTSARTPLYVDLLLQRLPHSTSVKVANQARIHLSAFPFTLEDGEGAMLYRLVESDPAWLALMHEFFRGDFREYLQTGIDEKLFTMPAPKKGLRSLMLYWIHRGRKTWKKIAQPLAKGWDPRSIVGQLRLRREFPGKAWKEECQPHQQSYRTIRRVMRLLPSKQYDARQRHDLTHKLWQACALQPGLAEVLEEIPVRRLTHRHLWELVKQLSELSDTREDWPKWVKRRWQLLRPHLNGIILAIVKVPLRYRNRALSLFEEVCDPDGRPISSEGAAKVPELIRLLCQVPYTTGTYGCTVIAQLFKRLPDAHQRSLTSNERLIRKLDQLAVSGSKEKRMRLGIESLRSVSARLYQPLIDHLPDKFVDLLQSLALLSAHEIKLLWQSYQEHPLITCPLESLPDAQAAILLDAVADRGEPAVPQKLREHLDGKVTLAEHVLEHYRQEMHANARAIQARVLHALYAGVIARSYPALRRSKKLQWNSITLCRFLRDKSRTLNRSLKLVVQDQAELIYATPKNETWLQSLPESIRHAWQEGFALERTLEKEGTVRIAPESDFQEVLMMGAYVGSCLTPGGLYDDAVPAVAYDANKKVLYARDSKGKVVGRQLVAISTESTLVCFGVYPTNASEGMTDFFTSYDLALAHHLKLRLNRSFHYDVAPLNGHYWYDDGRLDPVREFARD